MHVLQEEREEQEEEEEEEEKRERERERERKKQRENKRRRRYTITSLLSPKGRGKRVVTQPAPKDTTTSLNVLQITTSMAKVVNTAKP